MIEQRRAPYLNPPTTPHGWPCAPEQGLVCLARKLVMGCSVAPQRDAPSYPGCRMHQTRAGPRPVKVVWWVGGRPIVRDTNWGCLLKHVQHQTTVKHFGFRSRTGRGRLPDRKRPPSTTEQSVASPAQILPKPAACGEWQSGCSTGRSFEMLAIQTVRIRMYFCPAVSAPC